VDISGPGINMKSFILGVAVATIATVIGGIILLYIGPAGRSERAALRVEYSWLTAANARKSYDEPDTFRDLLRKLPNPDLPLSVYAMLAGASELRLVSVEISNGGSIRSGSLELLIPNVIVWYDGESTTRLSTAAKFEIDPLNPGDKRNVTAVSPGSYLTPPDLRVLEDGHLVAAISTRIGPFEDVVGLIGFVRNWPFLSVVFALLSAGFLIVILPVLIVFGVMLSRPDWRAKITSRDDVAKELRFHEYLRAHHPDKMPAVEPAIASIPSTNPGSA
jgi:hypothetical protein